MAKLQTFRDEDGNLEEQLQKIMKHLNGNNTRYWYNPKKSDAVRTALQFYIEHHKLK